MCERMVLSMSDVQLSGHRPDYEAVALFADAIGKNAVQGCLGKEAFDQEVDRRQVPAKLYLALLGEMKSRGIRIVSNEEDVRFISTQDEREDQDLDQGGYDGNGYVNFISHQKRILSRAEEIELKQVIETGLLAASALENMNITDPDVLRALRTQASAGERALEEFLTCNLRLVASVVRKYRQSIAVLAALSEDDLMQEGLFGLFRAVEKFDPAMGFKFSTYATWWIRQSISRAIANSGRSIRLPVHVYDLVWAVRSARSELRNSLFREPTQLEIAELLDVPLAKVESVWGFLNQLISLDRPLKGVTLAEVLGDDPNDGLFDDDLISYDLAYCARRLLDCLDERGRYVLERRFGIGVHDAATLEEVGKELGLTRERIRQIEKESINQLRAFVHEDDRLLVEG